MCKACFKTKTEKNSSLEVVRLFKPSYAKFTVYEGGVFIVASATLRCVRVEVIFVLLKASFTQVFLKSYLR